MKCVWEIWVDPIQWGKNISQQKKEGQNKKKKNLLAFFNSKKVELTSPRLVEVR